MKKVLLFLCAIFALSASALTYNVEVPAGTKACYIAGAMNGWSQQEMTKVDATHYTIDIAGASESDGYKYCSGPGWNYVEKDANGGEMGNRTYSANDVVARWASVFDPGVEVEKPEGDISIYLQVQGSYATTNLYVWDSATSTPLNGAWPGTAMTTIENVSGVDYYVTTFTAPENAINIIFNGGSDSEKTADILGVVKTTYYKLNGNNATEVTPGEVEETGVTYNVTVPTGTPSCFIAGEMNNWSFTEMTKVDETHYTITIAEATQSMKYKYCATASWENVEMEADGITDVQDRSYSANDVVAAWKGLGSGTVTPDPETPETLVYNVTVPAGTPACYIVGVFNDWGSFVAMDMIDETHYTITIDNTTKSSGYKYTCGESWEYVEMMADGITDVQDRSWSAGDVVEAWKTMPSTEPETPETLVYNVEVPAGTYACYIAGGMNDWSFSEMTKVDDTHYTITFDGVTKSVEYKYFCGPDFSYAECWADLNYRANRTWTESDVVEAWESTWSSVEGVEAADVVVYGANDVLCIRAAEETTFAIYNAQGMLVKAVTVNGAADINLAAGLYIVNGAKVLVY